MYGYIKPRTAELRVRENEYFRAVYCGVCRRMGKCTGRLSRVTLSYDITFLALLRMAVIGGDFEFDRKRCIVHPTSKRAYATECEVLDYCAYASALLAYGKNLDDIKDERGIRRLRARVCHPELSHMRRKAKKQLESLEQQVLSYLSELSEIEKQRPASVDIPAEVFGKLFACISCFGTEGKERKILSEIGRHIGKWLYIADAVDDISEDMRRGRYNPVVCLYGEELDADELCDLRTAMLLELAAAYPAYDLIDFSDRPDLGNLTSNILRLGLRERTEEIVANAERVFGTNSEDPSNERKNT